jgi:hypothetical protein
MKLTPWREMSNYVGTNYSDYLIAAQRLFRCSKLEQATFAYIREHMHDLEGESYGTYPSGVLDVTFQDECLVYRYMVLVHKDFAKGIRMAEMFADRLDAKGYVDPDSATVENDDEFEEYERLPSPEVFGAAEPSGIYKQFKVEGGAFTTFTIERKSRAKEREAAKRELLLAETGSSPVARKIDGVYRRWGAVPMTPNDDHQPDALEF